MIALGQTLFYAAGLPQMEVAQLVYGFYDTPVVDTIDFADEEGGTQQRMLAIPFLPSMDTVTVTDASFDFRVGNHEQDIAGYSVGIGPGGKGAVLRLDRPSLLRKVEIQYQLDGASELPDPSTMRVIVRPVDGSDFGPPIYSAPDFPPPGAGGMFDRVLTGMNVRSLGGNRHLLELPDVLGSGWLIQVATAREVTEIAAMAVVPEIRRVAIAATPTDLAISLSGSPPSPLWGNPGALLPDSGTQQVSFLPLAQRRMSEALESASPDALTLPLEIDFASSSGAQLEVTRRSLAGYYSVDPLGGAPANVRLGGRSASLALLAPGGLRPMACEVTLSARLVGRELNGGSREAPIATAGSGLRIEKDRQIAAKIEIAARPGDAPGANVPLCSIGGYFEVSEQTEMVLELKADAANRPGAPLSQSMVHQFNGGEAGWVDLDVDQPLALAPGTAIWATIRVTKGELYWHYGGDFDTRQTGEALVSIDEGESWGDSTSGLSEALPLLVQAFHEKSPPLIRPKVRLSIGDTVVAQDWFSGAVSESATQYGLLTGLPAQVLNALANAPSKPGGERTETLVTLYSDTVLDLTLSDAKLDYDPATVRAS